MIIIFLYYTALTWPRPDGTTSFRQNISSCNIRALSVSQNPCGYSNIYFKVTALTSHIIYVLDNEKIF